MNVSASPHDLLHRLSSGQRYNIDGHKRPLYVHETMATDTSNISTVFSDVKVRITFNSIQ
jgi:hypothetical protein